MDMLFEDLISKEDLKEQVAYYDSEIARLTAEINGHQNRDTAHRRQMEKIQSYIDKMRSITADDTDNTEIYAELVQKVIVRENRTVDVYLNCVPLCFRVKYHVEKYLRIRKYDIFIDACEVVA